MLTPSITEMYMFFLYYFPHYFHISPPHTVYGFESIAGVLSHAVKFQLAAVVTLKLFFVHRQLLGIFCVTDHPLVFDQVALQLSLVCGLCMTSVCHAIHVL